MREPARKRAFQFQQLARGGRLARARPAMPFVDRVAILPRGRGDVFRRLHAAFDLQRIHARGDQLRHEVQGRKVRRAEQILAVLEVADFAVADQFIRQPALLAHGPAIGAASAHAVAGVALAGVAHAECAVDEDFEFHLPSPLGRGLGDAARIRADVFNRKLAGEHDAADAQPRGHRHAFGAGDRHLRRGMELESPARLRGSAAPRRNPAQWPHRRRPRRPRGPICSSSSSSLGKTSVLRVTNPRTPRRCR